MIDKWLEILQQGKCIPEHDIKILCDKVKDIFIEESNVQPVTVPVIICGESMVKYMIYFNYLKKEEQYQILDMYLWEIM